MRLVSFSVENYRSITTARKIPLSNYSLLVGANNEGKSNILHALALAMNALAEWHRNLRRTADGRLIRSLPAARVYRQLRSHYDWETDFPITKQDKYRSNGKTNITLEFELSSRDIIDFKTEIKSNLNGTLPLMISFGPRPSDLNVAVKKQGPGQETLTKKSNRIASFVSRRIKFEYIPAIRTAESASRVITHLVESELSRLEGDAEYASAMAKIEELQQPVFDELSEAIRDTVSSFLPSVQSVKLQSWREGRYRSLRRDVEIIVDDGQLTRLDRKGDGVQSLVALALMRHASEQSADDGSTIIAIEEPESHLHPKAIHELRSVIETLALNNQVVLTSHSPIFVNPDNLKHTIIVKSSKAAPAARISEVRDALGVRFSDNLHNARMVLLVEGAADVTSLRAIVEARCEELGNALRAGTIIFDSLGGASGLRQKASFYLSGACLVQCFLDDDAEGRTAVERAIRDKTLKVRDVNMCSVPHLEESELEDLYDKALYANDFHSEFGVNLNNKPMGKAKKKWSNVIERLFRESGKLWDETIKHETKVWLAAFAAKNADRIIRPQLAGPIDSFIETAVAKLPEDFRTDTSIHGNRR